jgi:hypothetical protein
LSKVPETPSGFAVSFKVNGVEADGGAVPPALLLLLRLG